MRIAIELDARDLARIRHALQRSMAVILDMGLAVFARHRRLGIVHHIAAAGAAFQRQREGRNRHQFSNDPHDTLPSTPFAG